MLKFFLVLALFFSGLDAATSAEKCQDVAAGAIGSGVGEAVALFAMDLHSQKMMEKSFDEIHQLESQKGQSLTQEEFTEIFQKNMAQNAEFAETAAKIGQVAGATGAFVTGRDVNTAADTAKTSTENNFLPAAIQAARIGYAVYSHASELYEYYQTYQQGGIDAVVTKFGKQAVINLAMTCLGIPASKATLDFAKKSLPNVIGGLKTLEKYVAKTFKSGVPAPKTKVPKTKIAHASPEVKKSIQGGSYAQVKKANVGTGKEAHHPIADSISPMDRNKAPSVALDKVDHAKTKSYANTKKSIEYRKEQKELLEQGKYRDAMAKDIWDVRSFSGTKYNKSHLEMLDYAKTMEQFKKK